MIIHKILNVDDYYFNVFMSISKALTGYSVNELQSTGLAEEYYKFILRSMEAATFVEFLDVSKSILESSDNEGQLNKAIAEKLITDESMQGISQKIITMWYLGTWNGSYITDRSYTEGLVWDLMQSHPPGAKQPGFKSWSVKPINS